MIVYTQYNEMLREFHSTLYNRKKVLEDLINYINKVRNKEGIDNIMLTSVSNSLTG